jgi:hypothetical protein
MEIISLAVGFIIGVILVGIAIEIGTKKSTHTPQTSKQTKKWSISEISNPKIIAEYLSDVDIPKNSKLLVNNYKDKKRFAGLNVKEHKGLKGNYIVGDDRALILAGPMKKDEVGFWTVEKDIVSNLNREFDEMWSKGTKIDPEEKRVN